jgi:uncharacterized RDD family membrane protein YckC
VAAANPNPYAPPTADLETRTATDGEERPATRGERLGAALLDGLITLPFLFLVGGLAVAVFGSNLLPGSRSGLSGRLLGQLLVIVSIAPLWIYQWRLIARTGQTLGKKWIGIKIVRMDGSPVDFVSGVLLRSWTLSGATMLIAALGAQQLGNIIGLVDALMIFGEQRRTMHDHIAGTRVISVKRAA